MISHILNNMSLFMNCMGQQVIKLSYNASTYIYKLKEYTLVYFNHVNKYKFTFNYNFSNIFLELGQIIINR